MLIEADDTGCDTAAVGLHAFLRFSAKGAQRGATVTWGCMPMLTLLHVTEASEGQPHHESGGARLENAYQSVVEHRSKLYPD